MTGICLVLCLIKLSVGKGYCIFVSCVKCDKYQVCRNITLRRFSSGRKRQIRREKWRALPIKEMPRQFDAIFPFVFDVHVLSLLCFARISCRVSCSTYVPFKKTAGF